MVSSTKYAYRDMIYCTAGSEVLSEKTAGMHCCRLQFSVAVHEPGLAIALDAYALMRTLPVPRLTARGRRASRAA